MTQVYPSIRLHLLWLSLSIALVLGHRAEAQNTYFISGQVKGPEGAPVPGASVRLSPGPWEVLTDSSGTFRTGPVAAGHYILRVSALGYAKIQRPFTLGGEMTPAPFLIQLNPGAVSINELLVEANRVKQSKSWLPDIQGTEIFAGQKTDVISPDPGKTNLAQNEARMTFAQIPGLNIWEMDGAGTQVNIGSRGSNPHRSIEMNMRQNGYTTNSDIFGYAEDHYTPPEEGIQQVQLVRGASALQFGSQFGGMLNEVMKTGDSARLLSIESDQTAGSDDFYNSYNSVGGTVGKINYYAYYDNRNGNGFRPDAAFNYHAYYANIRYDFSKKGNLALQFSRMDYVQQIAGGETDSQFKSNPWQATRFRNYFNPEINIPALIFNYRFGEKTQLNITTNVLFGQRNSVQFIANPNVPDTFNTTLGSFNPRQVDRDYYSALSSEARLLHRYSLGAIQGAFSAGIRFSTELTRRMQKGPGTTGSNFDLSLVSPYAINLRFNTHNYAVFAENLFQITPRFSFTPGFRLETIGTNMDGVITTGGYPVHYPGYREFPLFGAGLQYQLSQFTQLYANLSQAYTPYLYANITPADQVDQIDPNLKDTRGYNGDFGYRGQVSDILHFDVDAYYTFYGNRVGLLTKTGPSDSIYLLDTNIGDAVAEGAEDYLEISLWNLFFPGISWADLRIFNSLAFDHARYINGEISQGNTNISLRGNQLENAPEWINRTGCILQLGSITSTWQYSYTGESFSDANNTVFNSTGDVGIVPAYHVWDWAVNWSFLLRYHLSGGINNLANTRYFTRRITMYPGPGILPADGRTFYIGFGMKI